MRLKNYCELSSCDNGSVLVQKDVLILRQCTLKYLGMRYVSAISFKGLEIHIWIYTHIKENIAKISNCWARDDGMPRSSIFRFLFENRHDKTDTAQTAQFTVTLQRPNPLGRILLHVPSQIYLSGTQHSLFTKLKICRGGPQPQGGSAVLPIRTS